MQRVFDADFSGVRVFQDDQAQEAGARAFARGTDLHFAPGEYSPHSSGGQALLGHELAHVAQQAEGRVSSPAQNFGGSIKEDPALEREADIMGDRAARNDGAGVGIIRPGRLALPSRTPAKPAIQRKVQMPPDSDLPSFHDHLIKSGDIYYTDLLDRSGDLSLEVFTSLFHSPRIFKLKGDNGTQAEYNLMRHMEARRGVVAFARQKKYVFEGGRENFQMNPKYWWWDKEEGTFGLLEGVDWQEARDDLNVNPDLYRIGCAAATKLTVEGGGQSKRKMGTTEDSDWVPGESGFIKNNGWNGSDAGLEGENIIYMGARQFWGHFTNTNMIQPYKNWFEMVQSWDDDASLDPDRQWPGKGLID